MMLVSLLLFPLRESLAFLVMVSFSFCLLSKVIVLLCFWRTTFLGMEFLVGRVLCAFFSILNMSSPFLLTWKVPVEKSADCLTLVPSLISCCFENPFFVCTFDNSVIMFLSTALSRFKLFGSLTGLFYVDVHFSFQVWEVFSH